MKKFLFNKNIHLKQNTLIAQSNNCGFPQISGPSLSVEFAFQNWYQKRMQMKEIKRSFSNEFEANNRNCETH
jgi:hypothetical protein